jgi:hypothetical protein
MGAVIPFQLAINVKINSTSKTDFALGLLQDVSHFEDEEISHFISIIDTMRTGEFYISPTGQTERIEDLFSKSYELYKSKSGDSIEWR